MDAAVRKAVDEAIHGIGRWWPRQWIARQAMWQADPLGEHTRVERVRGTGSTSSTDNWSGKTRSSATSHVHDVATTGWLRTQVVSAAWGEPKPSVTIDTADREYAGLSATVILRSASAHDHHQPDISTWPSLPTQSDRATWTSMLAEVQAILGEAPGRPSAELHYLGWGVPVTDEAKAIYAAAVAPAIETRRAEIMAEVDRLATVIASLYRADDDLAEARAEYAAAGGRGGPGPWITLSEESLRLEAEGRRAAIR